MAWFLLLLLALGMAEQDSTSANRLEAAREWKRRGSAAEAAKAYESLLPQVRASSDRKLLAPVLLESGQVALTLGEYARALDRGREAASLFNGLQDLAQEALAENLAGSAAVYQGDYPASIAHYQRALALDRRQHDAKGEINRLNNIANAYFFQGKYLDALEGYQAALRRAEENAHEPWGANRRQMALTNLAVLYEQLGQNQQALAYYRQALAGQSALAPAEHGQLLSSAGTLYRRLGDAVKALEIYRQAQALFATEPNSAFEIHVLQNVGIVLALDLQDLRGAEQSFTGALVKAEATANRREIVLAHLFRAELYLRAERWDAAHADFSAALEVARAIGAAEEQWTALYGLARLHRQAGRPREALAILHEAIAVIEHMRSSLGASTLKSEFLGNKRDVYDAAIGLTLESGAYDAESIFRLIEQARSRNLQDALRGTNGAVSLHAVQSRLDDSLLIEYWAGDGKLASFWVSRNAWGVNTRPWTPADATELTRLVTALRGRGADWRESAGRIGAQLIGPIPQVAAARSLLIVPDGPLYQLPFEALPPVPGAAMLIENSAVSYLPSAALLLRAAPRAGYLPPWRRQLVGFGDPLPNAGAALPGDELWARLPQSVRELNSIAHALPGRATIHAGEEDQKRYLFGPGTFGTPLLHFATHAVADTSDPNRSRILFTREPGSRGSEYLFRPEVQTLRLDETDLVTLSACDTEGGKLVRGEGVQSFSRSFLAAGAHSTVTALWSVEDRATADFMEIFYQHLAAGQPKAEALRAAKLNFLHRAGERAHPGYWAAFVLNGNGQQSIRPVFSWTWIAVPALGIAALITVAYRRRRDSRFHRS